MSWIETLGVQIVKENTNTLTTKTATSFPIYDYINEPQKTNVWGVIETEETKGPEVEEKKPKKKVVLKQGEFVTGNKENIYPYTGRNGIYQIIHIKSETSIFIKVIMRDGVWLRKRGTLWEVDAKYFRRLTKKEEKAIINLKTFYYKVGDIVVPLNNYTEECKEYQHIPNMYYKITGIIRKEVRGKLIPFYINIEANSPKKNFKYHGIPAGFFMHESVEEEESIDMKDKDFKVGDYVKGTEIADGFYFITDKYAICKVIRITGNNNIEVKLISTTNDSNKIHIGQDFIVQRKYFERVDIYTIGDIVEVKGEEGLYIITETTDIAVVVEGIHMDARIITLKERVKVYEEKYLQEGKFCPVCGAKKIYSDYDYKYHCYNGCVPKCDISGEYTIVYNMKDVVVDGKLLWVNEYSKKGLEKKCCICGKTVLSTKGKVICEDHDNLYICKSCGKICKKNGDATLIKESLCRKCYGKKAKCKVCGRIIDKGVDQYYNTLNGKVCKKCKDKADDSIDERIINITEYEDERAEVKEFKNAYKDKIINDIAEFYILELLDVYSKRMDGINPLTTIASFVDKEKACKVQDVCYISPFWNRMEERLSDRKDFITNALERFFVRYIFMSCCGEARWAYSKTSNRLKSEIPEWISYKYDNYSDNRISRDDIWAIGYRLSNLDRAEILAKSRDIYDLFTKFIWTSGYGGQKWGKIIKHLINYLEGRINKMVFIDQAISLVHNGSIFLDKIGTDIDTIKKLLDLKFRSRFKDISKLINYTYDPFNKYYDSAYEWLGRFVYGVLSEKILCTFKVGDIITGKDGSSMHYGITNENGKYKVCDILSGGTLYVEVIEHIYSSYEIGNKYEVEPILFIYCDEEIETEFEIGDTVTGIPGNHYDITNENGTYEIVGVDNNNKIIDVKVITHIAEKYIGNTYNDVKMKHFKKVLPTATEIKEEIKEVFKQFKVGDILIGIGGNTAYDVTGKDCVVEVVKPDSFTNDIKVKVIKQCPSENDKFIGDMFHVESKYFKKIPKEKAEEIKDKEIKVGDIVKKSFGHDYYKVEKLIDNGNSIQMLHLYSKVKDPYFENIIIDKKEHKDEYEKYTPYFKVGDKLKGIGGNDIYSVTGKDSIVGVVEPDSYTKDIKVKLISNPTNGKNQYIGTVFPVQSKYFIKIEE